MPQATSVFFKVQLLIQGILTVMFWLMPEKGIEVSGNILALIGLIFIGIPHGSNDVLYAKSISAKGKLKFIAYYISSMLVYALLWFWSPMTAFIIFFLMSIHHFGQSNFENSTIFYLPSILWGSLVLFLPVITHQTEAFSVFSEMLQFQLEPFSGNFSKYFGFILFLIYSISLILFSPIKKSFLLFVQAFLVMLFILKAPLISGFIIVFCLWHSSQSLYYQWEYFKKEKAVYSTKNLIFWKNMIIFSIISFIGLGLIHWIHPLNIPSLFILLSIITFPHAIVMHGIYKN